MAQIYKPKRNRPNNTQIIKHITVDVMDHHGDGIVTQHKPLIVVKGGLPGEACKVLVTQQKKRVWHANIQSVITPNPHRQSAFCPHYGQCGGCQLQHIETTQALSIKQNAIDATLSRALSRQLSWSAPIESKGTGYRRKARLAIDTRDMHNRRLGFRGKPAQGKQNAVVSISECQNLSPALQSLIKPLQRLLTVFKTTKALGHITLIDCLPKVLVSIRLTQAISAHDINLLQAFESEHKCKIAQEFNAKEQTSNNNQTPQVQPLVTQASHNQSDTHMGQLSYNVDDDITLYFDTNDFIQINAHVNQMMIRQAKQWLALNANDELLDLFCGIGNFTLPISRQVKSVMGIEGVAKMVKQATHNAKINNINNTAFVHADLSQDDALTSLQLGHVNKVVLDPARDGALAIVNQLQHLSVTHVLYVSCNADSFTRDAKVLEEKGFVLDKVCVMDMFPNTSHIELMGLFLRDG